MSHWFDISRWREMWSGNSVPKRATPDPEPDLYQHRVQRIIAQNRRATLPIMADPDPAANIGATDQRISGTTKPMTGATSAVIANTGFANTDEPEEPEHWISFGVGMAAGIACGWALLFFTMAAMEPEPSSHPRDGATRIAVAPKAAGDDREDIASDDRVEAARRVLERQVALATAKVLTPPDSGGVERAPARDLPVEEAAGPPPKTPVRREPERSRPPEPHQLPVLPTPRDRPRPAPKPTVTAVTTKPHFDFAGSGHMSRLGASNVTAREVFAQSNPAWSGPPPVPSRHPLTGTAKRKAASLTGRSNAKRRTSRRGSATAQSRRRNATPRVVRLSQPAAVAAPQPPEPEKKPPGFFSTTGSDANWARRVLSLDSDTR